MSDINGILEDLRRVQGLKGSAVLTTDGMMVASTLSQEFIDDVVAGLTSFLISTTRRSLAEAQMGRFARFVLNATHGKVILVDIGEAFLVVITDQFAELQQSLVEIQEAASELRRVARIHM